MSSGRPVSSKKEVMMVTDVSVEIGVAGIHHDLAQQPCLDELVQRIVDNPERHPARRLDRFAVGIGVHDHLVIGRKGHARFRSLG